MHPEISFFRSQYGDRLRAVRSDVTTFRRFAGAGGLKERLARRRDELLAEVNAVRDRFLAAEESAPRPDSAAAAASSV